MWPPKLCHRLALKEDHDEDNDVGNNVENARSPQQNPKTPIIGCNETEEVDGNCQTAKHRTYLHDDTRYRSEGFENR